MAKPKVSFRISQEKLDQIDHYVKSRGSFKNRSEFILCAIAEFLESLK